MHMLESKNCDSEYMRRFSSGCNSRDSDIARDAEFGSDPILLVVQTTSRVATKYTDLELGCMPP